MSHLTLVPVMCYSSLFTIQMLHFRASHFEGLMQRSSKAGALKGSTKPLNSRPVMRDTVIKKQFLIHISCENRLHYTVPSDGDRRCFLQRKCHSKQKMCNTWFIIANVIQVPAPNESAKKKKRIKQASKKENQSISSIQHTA